MFYLRINIPDIEFETPEERDKVYTDLTKVLDTCDTKATMLTFDAMVAEDTEGEFHEVNKVRAEKVYTVAKVVAEPLVVE